VATSSLACKKEEEMEELALEAERIREVANRGVRPSERMIRFYNLMAKIPLKLGMVFFLVSAIDTGRVSFKAMQRRTDAAIQVIYEYRPRPWRLLWGLGDHVWLNSYNCRSVRARGFFTKEIVRFLLQVLCKRSKKVRAVSLGSGSASQTLSGVAESGLRDRLQFILVDNDSRALDRGENNARCLGLEKLVETKKATAGNFLRSHDEDVDFVEMVGLTDYFPEEKFSEYVRGVYFILNKGGVFLGTNISSKEEKEYAHKVACWPPMHYRKEEEIKKELLSAGFEEKNIWTGNVGLYTMWLARK